MEFDQEEAKATLREAKEAARSIETSWYRSTAFLEIMRVEMEFDQEGAKELFVRLKKQRD